MTPTVQHLMSVVFEAIEQVYAAEKKRIDTITWTSPLHDGIQDYLKITYHTGKLTLDTFEPFDWSDHDFERSIDPVPDDMSSEQLEQEFMPAFTKRFEAILLSNTYGPRFFRYQLTCYLDITIAGKSYLLTKNFCNEHSREALKRTLAEFVEKKLDAESLIIPTEEDDFFFMRLILDSGLHSLDVQRIEHLLDQVSAKVRRYPKRESSWNGSMVSGLTAWVEHEFLNRYADRTGSFDLYYVIKPGVTIEQIPPQEMELFLAIALRVGPWASDKRKEYLELAVQLGSVRAKGYVEHGSGSITSQFQSEYVTCKANDVLQAIDIQILSEEGASYRDALRYLCDLLQQGFPQEYSMKLKSKEKHFLPIPKLAKSKIHQFFANALRYTDLHSLIASYAEAAMQEFAWYNDVQPGEKSVMPGTYAVFGLGLADEAYFPLVIRYMSLVDQEHQSMQDAYAANFAEAHGITTASIPALVAILLGGGESAKPVKTILIETAEQASVLMDQIEGLEDYQQEKLVYRIWGSDKHLRRALQSGDASIREILQPLL